MNATSGPSFEILSPSANLQQSLGNRLRRALDVNGSAEYALTWKHWDMLWGPPICALRASARRTSDKDCSGWATPSSRDWKDSPGMATTGTNPDGTTRSRADQLPRQVVMISGPTPPLSNASTEKRAGLNPEFPRWLMGFLEEWGSCAPTVTPSSRKSRRSS